MLSGAQNADRSAEMRRKTLTVRQKMRGWLGWLTGWGSFFSAQRYAFSVAFLTDGSYFVSRHPSPRAFSVQRYVFSVATKHLHAFSARRLPFPTPIVLQDWLGSCPNGYVFLSECRQVWQTIVLRFPPPSPPKQLLGSLWAAPGKSSGWQVGCLAGSPAGWLAGWLAAGQILRCLSDQYLEVRPNWSHLRFKGGGQRLAGWGFAGRDRRSKLTWTQIASTLAP